MNPDELRREAAAAEFLARLVSYAPDKQRMAQRAAELRRQAEELEERLRELPKDARSSRTG